MSIRKDREMALYPKWLKFIEKNTKEFRIWIKQSKNYPDSEAYNA